jgi:hypothetical protein
VQYQVDIWVKSKYQVRNLGVVLGNPKSTSEYMLLSEVSLRFPILGEQVTLADISYFHVGVQTVSSRVP